MLSCKLHCHSNVAQRNKCTGNSSCRKLLTRVHSAVMCWGRLGFSCLEQVEASQRGMPRDISRSVCHLYCIYLWNTARKLDATVTSLYQKALPVERTVCIGDKVMEESDIIQNADVLIFSLTDFMKMERMWMLVTLPSDSWMRLLSITVTVAICCSTDLYRCVCTLAQSWGTAQFFKRRSFELFSLFAHVWLPLSFPKFIYFLFSLEFLEFFSVKGEIGEIQFSQCRLLCIFPLCIWR